MAILEIETAAVFEPLLHPSRYKGAHGGRGSGKSHFFAEMLVEDAMRHAGLRAVCIREVQKSLKESAKRLIEDKIDALGVGSLFEVQTSEIKTPGGGVIMFQGMQDHTAESIKSLEGVDRAWVEEGQTLSDRSWRMLRPTIRKDESEIWASWNPRLRSDPIDKFFRVGGPGIVCVQANWRDNPWFPSVLEDERLRDLENDPDGYGHTWEGDYATVRAGAYYAKHLREAKDQGRIGFVPTDPLLPIKTFHDIGGAGAKADHYSIVVEQWVSQERRILHHYSAQGQPLAAHVEWLRSKGFGSAEINLPHDGLNANNVSGKSYEQHWREAGFPNVRSWPNAGAGAAMQRVEATRRLFPRMRFNEETTQALIASVGWYHAKIDEERGIDLGPEHDWASHDCDALGLGSIAYNEPSRAKILVRPRYGTMA